MHFLKHTLENILTEVSKHIFIIITTDVTYEQLLGHIKTVAEEYTCLNKCNNVQSIK